jgi:hypothetical protein
MEVKLWCKHAAEGLDQARADALIDVCTGIIADTPIDTGLARGNWQSSLGEAKTDKVLLIPTMVAINEVISVVKSMKGDETFVLRNNLPYATRLEFGWSKQAPVGMVRKNVQRWNSAVGKAAARARAL